MADHPPLPRLRRLCRLYAGRPQHRTDVAMFDLILGLTVAAFLFVCLGAALLRPDRF